MNIEKQLEKIRLAEVEITQQKIDLLVANGFKIHHSFVVGDIVFNNVDDALEHLATDNFYEVDKNDTH